ncbi:hypothetical protein IQ266_17015 [filamentous cyanobacterium LEGE 11480]|uniref:Uncharacterized protein n=1 Tax=Romeriopsis navalis LEGE 11480 TaxID=2777977 RepID=A0A928VPM1_9CYAN|nr:hypothetical protein [Romeriopsis navalis]MBE9031437.1 hypothetical protein [Romeriopsis navalis LEGE 11480]
MPRLVGKKPSYTLWILPVVVMAAIGAAAVQMEYTGTIDMVPQFGREQT